MNCWKAVNYSKQYGAQRLFILSSLTMLFTFVLLYVPVSFFSHAPFQDGNFLLFLAALWLIYPAHKLLHLLPVLHLGGNIKKTMNFKYGLFPIIHIKAQEPVEKKYFMLALAMPFVVINTMLVYGANIFPEYTHYFTILLAYHVGVCLPDLISGKCIFGSPRDSYIEESEDGIEILVYKSMNG
ncbi:DUF3267 domain-containing protein [Mesobacillus harenae]|uniref:DUF3267 domain-containing protein n=1 Tax=Mesobacillus harenae TaxID=2213203 RepID=UPI001580EB1A|nr:DUF3267 domain-containing protein [Mesobacillus harenae]